MEAFVQENITTYGPIAVFLLLMLSALGFAVGEEMVMIPAGTFIATGELDFFTTAGAAYVAIVIADSMWFGICRHVGMPILHKRLIRRMVHPRRLLQLKHQLDKRGVGFIIAARFVPSSRTIAITLAAIFGMRFWKFLVVTAVFALVTVPLQLGVGWLIGKGLGLGTHSTERLYHVFGLIVLILFATFVFNWWRNHRVLRHGPPRAKISWLKRAKRGQLVRAAGARPAPGGGAGDV